MTVVVNLRSANFDVFIGRPSKWGNPYSHLPLKNTSAKFKVSSRKEAIRKYEEWVLGQNDLLNSLHELKDKTLGCYCKPLACHGDVLVKLIEHRLLEHGVYDGLAKRPQNLQP